MIITITQDSEDGSFVTCTGYEVDHLDIPEYWHCIGSIIVPCTPDLAHNALGAMRDLGGMGSMGGADIHDI